MEKIKSPVLVIHGTKDEIVDVPHGEALYKRCPSSVQPLFVIGASHNDVAAHDEYLTRMRKFINVDLVQAAVAAAAAATASEETAETAAASMARARAGTADTKMADATSANANHSMPLTIISFAGSVIYID